MGERAIRVNVAGKQKPNLLQVVILCWLTTKAMEPTPGVCTTGVGATSGGREGATRTGTIATGQRQWLHTRRAIQRCARGIARDEATRGAGEVGLS